MTSMLTRNPGHILDELDALLPGQVSAPGDPDWDENRLGWVRSVDQQPYAVVAVADAADVRTAVRWAVRHGIPVTAQPVGHGATRALDGALLLRTRALGDIDVDVERRVARVGAGVKWGELLAVTSPHGLTGLAGSSPDPSVVGFCLGGGLSWFGRAHGLAAHAVHAIELVDASGEPRRVTAESDPDLFWALRGGGGDFGIVTAIEIALFPAPQLYGGRLMWPIEMARPVLRAYRDLTRTAPDGLTLWAHLLRLPPLPEIPEPLRGGAFVTVDAAYLGSAGDAEALLAPLRTLPALCVDTMAALPVAALGSIAAEPETPMPVSEVSELMHRLDDATIDRLVDVAGAGVDTPLLVVQLRHLGGALARGSRYSGPSGAVTEPYQLFAAGLPFTPEVAMAIEHAFVGLAEATAAERSGRTFFTFLGSDDDPTRAFGADALARLQRVKQRVDPAHTIRSNRPVLRG